MDSRFRNSVFSRTRARIDYGEDSPDFFSGLYLNHTFNSGLGLSVLGRINNRAADIDIGPHFYKQTKNLSFFGLLTFSLTDWGVYSWFSILRYRPSLNNMLKLYSSFELFIAMDQSNHLASTQRLRLGLDYQTYQFGLALNLTEFGNKFEFVNNNFGVFVRKEL